MPYLSGADTQNKYNISGTKGAECKDGIGKGDRMFVYYMAESVFFHAIDQFAGLNLLYGSKFQRKSSFRSSKSLHLGKKG